MKKLIANWRYIVIYALFFIGTCAAFLSIEQPFDNTLSYVLAAITVTSFYTLYRVVRHWERGGKIPKFSNPKIN